MKHPSYIRMLLNDERKSRKRAKELSKAIYALKGNLIKNIIDLYYEQRDLENIEAEIKSLTDTAFFTYTKPLCVEDILNDNGNQSTQSISGI
jgi:hypothetical protein